MKDDDLASCMSVNSIERQEPYSSGLHALLQLRSDFVLLKQTLQHAQQKDKQELLSMLEHLKMGHVQHISQLENLEHQMAAVSL